MFKRSLVAGALVLATFGPASAHDTVFNWSGLYIGVHGGHLSAETKYVNPSTPRQQLDGAIYGAQIGYNHQINRLVFGIEADWSRAKIDTNIPDGNFLRYSGAIDQMATVRGRIGYAFGNVLPYITAGWLWTELEQGASCPAGAGFGVCAITGAYNVSSKQTYANWQGDRLKTRRFPSCGIPNP